MNSVTRFIWNIYINHNTQPVEGVQLKGYELDLDQAKSRFRESFENLIAAGAVRIK